MTAVTPGGLCVSGPCSPMEPNVPLMLAPLPYVGQCPYPHPTHALARSPGLVSMPNGAKVVGAAAGRYVSMALDEQGRLYTWGHDGCSNGGKLPAREEAYKPRLVEGALAGGWGYRGGGALAGCGCLHHGIAPRAGGAETGPRGSSWDYRSARCASACDPGFA